jgi:hypothetical protein
MWNKLKSVFHRKKELATGIKILKHHLKDDPDYYHSWQANIAMAFYDECCRNKIGSKVEVYLAANAAAKNFLDLLIRK